MIRPSGREVMARCAVPLLVLAAGSCGEGTTPPQSIGSVVLQLVEAGFSAPLFLTAPPGDSQRLFIVEQTGLIRIVRDDSVLTAPFLDLRTLILCCGERGLLGLAFHPDYASNGRFFVHYSNTAGDTRVMRYVVSANPDSADPASAQLVLAEPQPYPNHNGGMLAFGPDGYLYIGLGDGGFGGDPQNRAQNPGEILGKMLRIDVNGALPYTVPPDNPFVGLGGYRPEIWSVGWRNPWRYSFDRANGLFYISDVGQGVREEVNIEPPGAGGGNYGWNIMEGAACYRAGCSSLGLNAPVLDYTHADGCAMIGGYVYRGQRIPGLQGHYFYSDYCRGWVRSFYWNGHAATDQRDWPSLAPGGTVSSFGEDAAGELYVLSHDNGTVHRFVPDPAATP